MLDEPLRTLVEKKLYTSDAKSHVRSEIYTIVYHATGPVSITRLSDMLYARVQQGAVSRPIITGLLHKVLLVEEAELARYRGSHRSGAEWKPDNISFYVCQENWLQEQIETMCNQTLNLLLGWAVSQHIDAMYKIATEQRLGAPVHITDDTNQVTTINAVLRRSESTTVAAGVNYVIDNVRWCHYNSDYQLWFYNYPVWEAYNNAG